MIVRRIENSSPAAIDDAAKVLTAAFLDDISAITIHDGRPDALLVRFRAAVTTSLLDLEAWGACEQDGEDDRAIMLVKPPGVVYGETPNSVGPHVDAFNNILLPKGTAYWNELKDLLTKLEIMAYGPDATKQSYYVSHLGTSPSARGKGLAGGLINTLVQRAKQEGEIVTLITQSDANLRFYTRLGFHVKGEIEGSAQGIPIKWWAMST